VRDQPQYRIERRTLSGAIWSDQAKDAALLDTQVDAIERNDMVFGIGPAGTGKTYLAVAMAVSALLAKKVNRIILARPAVEAGERLGFLPGTLQEKVDPYLRPLYDALYDMMDAEKIERALEKNIIEIAPIAFMRGRTLNDAFVIMDEAQNTTSEQMKMFVTRLGFGSKAVITGDITQIDLPVPGKSGLIEALEVLQGVEGIAFVHFDQADVVRHQLVQRIVRAYDEYKARGGLQLSLSLGQQEALTWEQREAEAERARKAGTVPVRMTFSPAANVLPPIASEDEHDAEVELEHAVEAPKEHD